ncbi:MAG TPA: hypothetical protein VGS18_02235 [Thermoplasmata archaeon]|nr:hypothetical protein [Thermoplasmata archaeon]
MSSPPSSGPIPSRRGAPILAFVGACVAEFALGPVVDTGAFSGPVGTAIGGALFAALLVSGYLFLARPIVPRMRAALSTRRARGIFLAGWALSVLAWAWVTAELRVVVGPAAPTMSGIAGLPTQSPFGSLPSLEFAYAPLGLEGYLSPLLLLSVLIAGLWCAAVTLTISRAGSSGPLVPSPARPRLTYAGLGTSWIPSLGLSMFCCGPPIAAGIVAAVGLPTGLLTSSWASTGDGNAFLLLASLLMVALALRGVTRPPRCVPTPSNGAPRTGEAP